MQQNGNVKSLGDSREMKNLYKCFLLFEHIESFYFLKTNGAALANVN